MCEDIPLNIFNERPLLVSSSLRLVFCQLKTLC